MLDPSCIPTTASVIVNYHADRSCSFSARWGDLAADRRTELLAMLEGVESSEHKAGIGFIRNTAAAALTVIQKSTREFRAEIFWQSAE